MWKKLLILGLTCSLFGFAQEPSKAPVVVPPQLLPGEGLAVADMEGNVHVFGEASKEAPMGSLA